mgnify:CR=1 FL=1
MWTEIIQLIQRHERFIITTHTNPDLDAVGCELALDDYLRRAGKQSLILNDNALARTYRRVDSRHRVHIYSARRHATAIREAQVIFALDIAGGWQRTGRLADALAASPAVSVRIDHHPDGTRFTHLEVVDSQAAATVELIFDLLCQPGIQAGISPDAARWLYLGLLTDTGSFRYPKTSPQTHRIAAQLIEAGADPVQLYRLAYEGFSLERTHLKGHVLASLQLAGEGRVAWCALDQDTLRRYGVQVADLDGFAGLGTEVGGVLVSVLCVALPNGQVKVSLRSAGDVAVNGLAAEWGGGGHPSAAGATLKGELSQVTACVVAKVEEMHSDSPKERAGA